MSSQSVIVCELPPRFTTHQRIPNPQDKHPNQRDDRLRTLQPHPARTPRQQIKVAQNRRPGILLVKELVEEEVDSRAEGVDGEVADVFCEVEDGKGEGEGEVSEGGLHDRHVSIGPRCKVSTQLTSNMIPGTNMTTANAWKYFLLAFILNTGNR